MLLRVTGIQRGLTHPLQSLEMPSRQLQAGAGGMAEAVVALGGTSRNPGPSGIQGKPV